MADLQYPIGKFSFPQSITADQRQQWIADIAELPAKFRAAAAALTEQQLAIPYRSGGWTARQVIHHVPDSHLNAYVRFKLALTETDPVIKPYDEAAWAKLVDSVETPVEISLAMLDCLHQRWVHLLRNITNADFARTFRHPDLGSVRLDQNLALYAWHGKHHTGHLISVHSR
jgi:hypothetical protein